MQDAFQNSTDFEAALQRSQERFRRYGLAPDLDGAPESSRLSDQELEKRIASQQLFFTLGTEQIDCLYRLLRSSNLCVTLVDAEGFVLYVAGDAALVEQCKRCRCVPGYRWTERDVGTSAIGLVLEERTAMVLPGEYARVGTSTHLWYAAAPVFLPGTSRLLGVIALCCYAESAHPHTLGLVRLAAENVVMRFQERRSLHDLTSQNHYLHAVLESDSCGLVTVDMAGRIVEATCNARKMLHLTADCAGELLVDNLDLPDWMTMLRAGNGFDIHEIFAPRSGKAFFVSMSPVRLHSGELVGGVCRLKEKRPLLRQSVNLVGVRAPFTFESMLGDCKSLRMVLDLAQSAAGRVSPVLLSGETGSGKTCIAQAIHNASPRCAGPFVTLDCRAISRELLEYELLGCEEGIPGASCGGRPGKIELADTGTLLLREIDAMPLDLQARLLHVLESGKVQRVGCLRADFVDVRILASTSCNLLEAVARHEFRADLFYNLSILHIPVPSLRDRSDDIVPLAEHFLQHPALPRPGLYLAPEAVKALLRHPWPGNIRQLQRVVERAAYLAKNGPILAAHLDLDAFGLGNASDAVPCRFPVVTNPTLDGMERHVVAAALTRFQGNITRAAAALGVSRPTLYRKIVKYGIEVR